MEMCRPRLGRGSNAWPRRLQPLPCRGLEGLGHGEGVGDPPRLPPLRSLLRPRQVPSEARARDQGPLAPRGLPLDGGRAKQLGCLLLTPTDLSDTGLADADRTTPEETGVGQEAAALDSKGLAGGFGLAHLASHRFA